MDGFQTVALPQTSAKAAFQLHTATGKLKAVMTPIGPRGCHCSARRWPGRSPGVSAPRSGHETPGEKCLRGRVSREIASLLVEIQLERLPIDFLDHRAALFAAVTHDQARRVARQLFDPEKLSFVVVGNPADLTPTRTRPEPRF